MRRTIAKSVGGALKRVATAGAAVLLAASMVVSTPLAALAETTTSAAKVTLDKVATPLDENDQTNVTLSIGSTESKENVAVAFVFDYSTSADVRNAALQMAEELASKQNTNIKVAVVNFNYEATTEGWKDLNGLTEQERIDLFTKTPRSGTNYHAGLLKAQELLASSEIDGYTPYLVTVSDGVTYIWNEDANGDGVAEQPSSIWSNYSAYSPAGSSTQNGSGTWVFKYVDKGVVYGYERLYEGGFSGFLQSAPQLYQQTKDAGLVNSYVPDQGFTATEVGTKAVLFDSSYNGVSKVMETTGKTLGIAMNTGNGALSEIESVAEGTNYLINSEVAGYKTATVFGELVSSMESAGYGNNVFALRCPEKDGNTTWESNPYGLELMQYMAGVTDTTVDDSEMSNATASETFAGIRDEILYEIESGTVTDVIGADFDLTDLNSLELTVGGKQATKTVEGNTVTFNNGDYVVTYAKAADGTETLTWEINVPVQQAAGVELSYDLTLVNKEVVPGDYTVPTNESATLEYTRHDGSEGTETFPVPDVTYTVEKPAPVTISGSSFNVSKVLKNGELKGGEYTFQLVDKATGEVVATAKNAADGSVIFDDLTYTYDDQGKHSYVISEVLPEDADAETAGVQDKDGVTYDQTAYQVDVEVAFNEETGKVEVPTVMLPEGGKTVFTNVAAVEEEPAPTPAEPEEPKAEEPKAEVPNTGDPTSFVAVAATLIAGVGAGSVGIALRRRNR